MAGFGFDDDDFSLSGLTQEGQEYDVTTIISSTDDENYDGLLQCARKLAGENSEGGVQAGVEICVEPSVDPVPSNLPISKTADSGLFLSNGMASSLSHSDQSIDVSFIIFRWFKFTLKPPNSIAIGKLRLAIWDTSFWTFWLKFGHKGP